MQSLKQILLVEDHPHDVELTLAALEQHKLANEVVVVNDGVEAMHFLRRTDKYTLRAPGNPAVVLLDLKMPKMDGLQVLAAIKGDDELRTIPVVMLTSSREESDLVASYRLGVNAYVVKPIDFQQFVFAVSQVGIFWALINEPPRDGINK